MNSQHFDEAQGELEILREELNQASVRLEQLESDNDRLASANQRLESEAERLKGCLGSQSAMSTEEVRRAESQAARKSEELDRARCKIDELERQIVTESDEYADLSVLLAETYEKVESLTSEVESIGKEREELKSALADREGELAIAEARSRDLAQEQSKLERLYSETSSAAVEAEQETARLSIREAELTEELSDLREKFRALAVAKLGESKGDTVIISKSSETAVSD